MADNGKRYELTSVWDFADIPDDRLDVCLSEFASAIRVARAIGSLMNSTARALYGVEGSPIAAQARNFAWIDDDEKTLRVKLVTAERIPDEDGGQ
jgi:hypothetical protein